MAMVGMVGTGSGGGGGGGGGGGEDRKMWVGRQTIYDWEIPIPRMMGGPSGGVGIGLSHGVLVEVGSESGPVRVCSLGWAAVAWNPAQGRLSLHHPLHSFTYSPEAAELLFWTGMRVRWLLSGEATVCPAPDSGAPARRLPIGHLYWTPEPSPPPPLIPPAHDITLDLFPPTTNPNPQISPNARRMGEEAIVIPNAKEENLTMIIAGWKLRQELKRGEVRLEGGHGEGGLRLNPSSREVSLNSGGLRLYVSGSEQERLYLRGGEGRALRVEAGRISVNQTPSFFDHHGHLSL